MIDSVKNFWENVSDEVAQRETLANQIVGDFAGDGSENKIDGNTTYDDNLRKELVKANNPHSCTQFFGRKKPQDNQGLTNHCTAYSFAEVVENQLALRGFPGVKIEGEAVWAAMRRCGLGDENKGAWVHDPVKALSEVPIFVAYGENIIELRVKRWCYLDGRSSENLLYELDYSIAYLGGALSGTSNTKGMDVYATKRAQRYVMPLRNSKTKQCAHAMPFVGFDKKGVIALPSKTMQPNRILRWDTNLGVGNSWGDKWAFSGCCFTQKEHIKKWFRPVIFELDITVR